MPLGSTFEIGTQIILLKIDGFLKGWILNITPLKGGSHRAIQGRKLFTEMKRPRVKCILQSKLNDLFMYIKKDISNFFKKYGF